LLPAPKVPIFVVLRKWANAVLILDPDMPIEEARELVEEGPDYIEAPASDSSIKRWGYNTVFALLPYIDLPHEVLKNRGMAVLTADGQRGWVKWDMATCPMSSEAVKPSQCPEFMASLEEGNWEVIPIERREVDLEKHLRLRTDDGKYDLTASSLWDGTSCEWCGHPMEKHMEGMPCEACNAVATNQAFVLKFDESMEFTKEQIASMDEDVEEEE
jgi:hypothetical protein